MAEEPKLTTTANKQGIVLQNKSARILFRYLQDGVFVPLTNNRQNTQLFPTFSIHIKKAIELLDELQKNDPQQTITPVLVAIDTKELFYLYGKMLEAFKRNGFLSEQLLTDTGKLLQIHSLEKTRGDATHLAHIANIFQLPQSDMQPVSLYIADEIAEKILALQMLLNHLKIKKLSAMDIQETAIRQVLSHAFGHVLHRSIAISLANRYLARQRKSNVNFQQPDALDFQNFVKQVEASIFEAIYADISPDKQLQNIFENETETGIRQSFLTSQERLATGLEYMGLQFALEEYGMAGEDIEKIFSAQTAKHRQNFSELETICQFVKANQGSVTGLSYAILSLGSALEHEGRFDLLKYHPSLISYALGNEMPLIVEELLATFAMYEQA